MTEISLGIADRDADIEAARELCRNWLEWHWKHYPAGWPTGNNPMDPDKFEGILADLPKLHARPRGAILIASLNGEPVGCVMYGDAGNGMSDFSRMFVSEKGRGHGIGHSLLRFMFDRMIEDGYHKVIFSSATFLTHARSMYEAAGFVDTPHPPDFPPEWRNYVYFMERPLFS